MDLPGGPRSIGIGLLLCALLLSPTAETRAEEVEFDPLNFAFAAYLGSGIYKSGDRTIYILRVPISYPIRSRQDHPWGARLQILTTFGFYDLALNLEEFEIPDRFNSASILAGPEFSVPIKSNWRLMPFAHLGPARDFSDGDWVLVFGIGSRSRAEFPAGGVNYILWNKLLYGRNLASANVARDDFGLFETEIEAAWGLGVRMQKQEAALAVYFKSEFYFDEVEIQQPVGQPVEIRKRFEVGLKFGTLKPWKVWKIGMPRIGLGYRFGQGARSARFILSWRY